MGLLDVGSRPWPPGTGWWIKHTPGRSRPSSAILHYRLTSTPCTETRARKRLGLNEVGRVA